VNFRESLGVALKDHKVYTHPYVLFQLPHEALHLNLERTIVFSFFDLCSLIKLPYLLKTMN
jgi:hypothetical protein